MEIPRHKNLQQNISNSATKGIIQHYQMEFMQDRFNIQNSMYSIISNLKEEKNFKKSYQLTQKI